jgi:hypothetical protein
VLQSRGRGLRTLQDAARVGHPRGATTNLARWGEMHGPGADVAVTSDGGQAHGKTSCRARHVAVVVMSWHSSGLSRIMCLRHGGQGRASKTIVQRRAEVTARPNRACNYMSGGSVGRTSRWRGRSLLTDADSSFVAQHGVTSLSSWSFRQSAAIGLCASDSGQLVPPRPVAHTSPAVDSKTSRPSSLPLLPPQTPTADSSITSDVTMLSIGYVPRHLR